MENIGVRITEIIHYSGLNKTEFSEKIGLENNSTIIRIAQGKVKPSFSVIYKIMKTFPEINGNWLIVGRGSMIGNMQIEKQANDQTEICHECMNKDKIIAEKERLIESKDMIIELLSKNK